MPGMLYLVPTPIGNLGDISLRCRETLEKADFIAAEDTRVSLKLLNHLGIKKSLQVAGNYNNIRIFILSNTFKGGFCNRTAFSEEILFSLHMLIICLAFNPQ